MRNLLKTKSLPQSSEFYLLLVDIALFTVLMICTNGRFIQADNIVDMIIGYAPLGIMAAGDLVVIISGGIDMSFMAIATISQYLMALYMLKHGGNFLIIFVIAIATGIILGFVNAILVNSLKAPTMIITIATMSVFYGVLMWLTKGKWLNNFPNWFSQKTTFQRIAIPLGALVIIFAITTLILKYTRIGRMIYYIGGNLESAKRVGINILKVQLFVYGFAGATAAIGAIVQCYLIQNVAPNSLVGNEMSVIAMVVLGGVSLSGGKGSTIGTLLGLLLIASLSNGLVLLGISSYWQNLVVGAVILISFCLTGYRMLKIRNQEKKGGHLDEK